MIYHHKQMTLEEQLQTIAQLQELLGSVGVILTPEQAAQLAPSISVASIVDPKPKPKPKAKAKAKAKSAKLIIPYPMDLRDKYKLKLLIMYAQRGKTTVGINFAIEWLKRPARHVVVWIGPNSLALTKQTRARLTNEGLRSWSLSSIKRSKSNFNKVDQVLANLDKIDILSCCAHPTRWHDLEKLIEKLPDYGLYLSIISDESDDILQSERAQRVVRMAKESDYVADLLNITATPTERLLKITGDMELIRVKESKHQHYMTLNEYPHIDVSCIHHEYVHISVNYAASAIDELGIPGGSIWFTPAGRLVKSHEEMKEMLLDKGFELVVLINGKKKELTVVQNGECLCYQLHKWEEENSEVKDILAGIRKDYPDQSIAITGNLCESRGITLMSETFVIDYGVFSEECATSSEGMYQIIGRLLGPVKLWDKIPTLVCPEEVKHTALSQECIVTIANERSTSGEAVADTEWLREVKKEASTQSGMDFRSWLTHVHISSQTKDHLAGKTIDKSVRYVSTYAKYKVDGKFPQGIIEKYESHSTNKRDISSAMKRYNAYQEYLDTQEAA